MVWVMVALAQRTGVTSSGGHWTSQDNIRRIDERECGGLLQPVGSCGGCAGDRSDRMRQSNLIDGTGLESGPMRSQLASVVGKQKLRVGV